MPFSSTPLSSYIFPTYLLPSLKFRRRKSSTDSNVSQQSTDITASDVASTSTSKVFTPGDYPKTYLSGDTSRLRCSRCLTDLAMADQIISKGFTGRHGRAWLVSVAKPGATLSTHKDQLPNLPNTFTHKAVARQLVTGAHTVSDISCWQCGSVLGWKYLAAEEEAQKYKIGHFILETKKVCRTACWESDEDDIEPPTQIHEYRPRALSEEEEIQFDSQDEDECEELFLGIWDPKIAAQRRRLRDALAPR